MNDKNLVIVGVLAISAVIAGGLIYLAKTDKLADFWPKTNVLPEAAPTKEEPKKEKVEEVIKPKEEPAYKETLLVKDDFEITLPGGWQEIPNSPEVLLTAVDVREEITDEKAREIGFRTILSIKSDDLKRYSREYTFAEYIDSLKTSLTQAISSIEFTWEDAALINNNNAFFMEVESTRQEIEFKTLLVFIEGDNNLIWALSFNALQSSWPAYHSLFYQIAESFKL